MRSSRIRSLPRVTDLSDIRGTSSGGCSKRSNAICLQILAYSHYYQSATWLQSAVCHSSRDEQGATYRACGALRFRESQNGRTHPRTSNAALRRGGVHDRTSSRPACQSTAHATVSCEFSTSFDEVQDKLAAILNSQKRARCRSVVSEYAANNVNANLRHALHRRRQSCVPCVVPARHQQGGTCMRRDDLGVRGLH